MQKDQLKKIRLLFFVVLTVLIPLLLGDVISVSVKSFFYALSLSMKSVLVFVLPFIIFSFVFSCLLNLRQGALTFVILLVGGVFISNFIALNFGYASINLGLKFIDLTSTPIMVQDTLEPMWKLSMPHWISNEPALLLGFILGIIFSRYQNTKIEQIGYLLNKYANLFLKKLFIPLLPLFILGFVFKLAHDQVIQNSLGTYGPILLLILVTQWILILFWYAIAANFRVKKMISYLKNILPATFTGITTISSAASMPVLLLGAKKNLQSDEKAELIIPTIINIHTIGSAIGLTILALATLVSFNMPIPNYSTFLVFAFYTALAKYAVAAVPGGVVIVMAPILETYLGFTQEMTGLITAVYLMLDPFGTAANVTGNGVFPILFSRFYRWFSKKESLASASSPLEKITS